DSQRGQLRGTSKGSRLDPRPAAARARPHRLARTRRSGMRGEGSIIRRRTGVYAWSYWHPGENKSRMISLRTKDFDVATRRARKSQKSHISGTLPTTEQRTVTISELLDDYLDHLKADEKASWQSSASHAKPIREHFGHLPAASLETAMMDRFKLERKRLRLKP